MHNLLRKLGRRSVAPQDTANFDYYMIDTGGVLSRGMEFSAILEIELSPIHMDAAAVYEGNDISIKGAYIDGSPAVNITH